MSDGQIIKPSVLAHGMTWERAHHPTVAMATPIARKSTNTAERIVNTECQALLLNLQQMHNQGSGNCFPADAAVWYIH